ncbi:MAG: CotH kinase family protein, partial [Planctomycetota bacterium]|nr:CotH kinase family protein [Planctomycetota bacterium]
MVVAENAAKFQAKFGFAPTGEFGGNLENDGETICLCDAQGNKVDEVTYKLGFPWPTVGDEPGKSIQLINPAMDNDLGGSWRGRTPTPNGLNECLAANAPPLMRQVNHSPRQPKSSEPVEITVKVTDDDGVETVTLSYQIVEPGSYIALQDSQYQTNWTQVTMYDDGTHGDRTPNDNTYTSILPAQLQVHRRLIRYRITALDKTGLSVTGPYSDDPQPNFAYLVYNGVPSWRGANRPGVTPVIEYGPDVMRSLPVYHLITKKQDVVDSQYLPGNLTGRYGGEDYPWVGTLVYDGEVYDHIGYRSRGGVWRYSMGKNMWKFKFNRGHDFQARDDYGSKYETKWDNLNFSACIQQGDYQHRGEQGMFEALSFKLFNMVGEPASKTNWVHFRVIDEAGESGPTQYDGDFWGLYMTIEQMDGRFLDEHGLPDGNLYKMDGDYPDGCDKNNQGPTAVPDKSDVIAFRNAYQASPTPTAAWWRTNVNLTCYYGYRTILEGVHHYDNGD